MAKSKAIVRVDVRRPAKLLEVLEAQHEQRRAVGELGFSLCIDDKKRNIGYVILDWESLQSLEKFIESDEAREMAMKWPVVEIFEVLALQDIAELLKEIEQKKRQ